jgi:ABC-type cobalamin/Fe3+-siderophores transport system ATPase subunit
MKLDKLWIKDFKNLKDFSVDFDENSSVTVIVGWNGTGKSNLFEALVIIFRDLDLGETTKFAYRLEYICHGNRIKIDSDPDRQPRDRVRREITPLTAASEANGAGSKLQYLPAYVFGYYSGPSNRLKEYFAEHQRRYYDAVINVKDTDAAALRELKSLRRLFFAENHHSKYVLLAFFIKKDEKIIAFLRDYLRIVGLESVLFVMKKPDWGNNQHLWGARGLVRKFLEKLYDISLAPMQLKQRVATGIKKSRQQEFYYLYVKDVESLATLASDYESPSDFFASLESTDLSEVIHDVYVKVKIRNHDGTLTFRELSEGEQQLLMVLGLLRFTKEKESLILLDEPDTHLNPHWSIEYLTILKKIVDDEDSDSAAPEQETRHIIMSSHDPLVLATLERQQVQILKRDEGDRCFAVKPEMHPRGLGFTGILTSDMFGFRSDLDPITLGTLDKKVELSAKEGALTEEEKKELRKIDDELERVGFLAAFSDPYYSAFVKAWARRKEFEHFKKPFLSKKEGEDHAAITDEILRELAEEE